VESRTLAAAVGALISVIAATRTAAAAPIPTPNSQIFPKIAAGNAGFFAVWEDSRSGASDIYGTRLSGTGGVLDGAGIPIATSLGTEERADVAFFAGQYVVVWQAGDPGAHDVLGRTVGPDGALGATFVVAGGAGDQATPVIACGKTRCVVAYVDNASGSYDVFARPVDGAGVGAPVDVSQAPLGELSPLIVARADDYFVAWQDERIAPATDIFGARVLDTGVQLVVADVPPREISAALGDHPSGIASDGKSVLVTWTRGAGYPAELLARRVAWTGFPLGLEIPLAASGDNSDRSGVASDGTNFLVTWQDLVSGEVVGRRIRSDGIVVDGAAVRLSDGLAEPAFNTALAFGSGRHCLVWDDLRLGTTEDIFGACFNGSFARVAPDDTLVSTLSANSVPALPPLAALAALVAFGAAGLSILRRRT
jgi:hypothetical protein